MAWRAAVAHRAEAYELGVLRRVMTLLGVLFVILLLVAALCFAWVVGPVLLDRLRRRKAPGAERRQRTSVNSREGAGKAR
ncbi:hypothetical protein D3C77_458730 [compost metagenome]